MTIPNFAYLLAIIFAAYQAYEDRPRVIGWIAVILICVGLLWGSIIK